jgi:uncharacterized protein YjdB
MNLSCRTLVLGAILSAGVGCDSAVRVPSSPCGGECVLDSTIHAVLVSPTSAAIAVGGQFVFAASVDAGPGATNRLVKWSSNDSTIAHVDTTGRITAIKAGSTVIKATSSQDPTISGSAKVDVGAPTS